VGTESNLLSLSATESAVRGVPLLTGGDRVEQKCLFALEQGQLLEVFPLLTGGDRVEQVYLSALEQGQHPSARRCSQRKQSTQLLSTSAQLLPPSPPP
jgi:hypothetical protein